MKIVQTPDPVLAAKAAKLQKIDKDLLSLIEEMKTTLVTAADPPGIGLAAPQVGKSLQLFIIKQKPSDPFSIFINPEVTPLGTLIQRKSKKGGDMLEGCLSIKDIWGTVQRYPKVKVKWMDETGNTQIKTFDGFFATIIQHEFDHLQGILFPKHTLEQQGKLYKSHKDEKGVDIFDPVKL